MQDQSNRRRRVLIVDSPDQAEMYAIGLQHQGYEVLTASEWDAALALARTQRLAAIVLDVRLRNDAGWDGCRQLSTDPATRGIPIVVLTTSVLTASETAAREAGATTLLHKPCYPSDVVAELRALDGGDGAGRRRRRKADMRRIGP